MKPRGSLLRLIIFSVFLLVLAACTPEVGSDQWCDYMKEKPKGDWSVNGSVDYTKHCLF